MGINFEGPLLEAISIRASTGSEIIGNKVSGVVPVTYFFSGFSFTETEGIFVYPVRGDASKIVGKLRIADNDIVANGNADFAFGIQVDKVNADVEISGNTVSFPQNNGFLDHTGIGVFRGHSSVSILSNDISMASGSLDTFPIPIMVAGDLDARYVIAKNHVINMHPNGDGIEVRGGDFSEPTQGTLVFNNRVFMNSSADVQGSGVTLFGAVNNTLVVHNHIEGTSAFAFEVSEGANATSLSDSNIFVDNDISKLLASVADVYFGTNSSNTLFAGQCQTVIDLGLGNRISCGKHNNRREIKDHLKSVRAQEFELLRKNILDQRSDLP